MSAYEIPDLDNLVKIFADKVSKIKFDRSGNNILYFYINLKGQFDDNPLSLYIERFQKGNLWKYVPTISHVFKIRPATYYQFNFEEHNSLEDAFDEFYERGLEKYHPNDKNCEWKLNAGYQESNLKDV